MNTTDDRQTVWEGRHIRVRTCGRWEYVERAKALGGVVIVAVTDDGKLLLVEQHRVPLGCRVIELPAGLAGDGMGTETEDLVEAARRELREETGFDAAGWTLLTSGPTSAGLTNETNTFFRATGLRCVHAGGGDEHEQIQVHAVPLAETGRWLQEKARAGIMIDPKVYAGLFFVGLAPSA